MRTVAVFLLLCSSALAQDTIVGPNDIKVGAALTCPRFSTLYANKLIVSENTTQTLPATFDFDVIEVSGTLRLSRTYDTAGKFIVIQVLPGGSLDFGSASDPVLRKVDLKIKDSPLLTGTDGNLGPDPEQFGSGILIFGEWKAYGRQLNKTWTTMQPVAAGATTLTLTDTVNWQVGDELLLPDSRLAYDLRGVGLPDYHPIRRESPVTIAAISGNTVTLSKPLDFEHNSVNGQLPYVANCTRNIVIRSENPSGVRGHTMFMGTAHVNLYYTSFIGLGRTRPEPLDSFNSHTMHVGTNQIARYGGPHWHHVHGHADAQGKTGRLVGCFGDGSDVTKWFSVQHGTHDLLVTDNVARDFVGACFTTEDGFEVRGEYRRNFAAYVRGNGGNGKNNVLANNPGADGSMFWLHGSMHTIEDNAAANCAIGLSVVHINPVMNRSYPSQPGGENDTPIDPTQTVPLSFARFTTVGCGIGVEEWRTPGGWTATDLVALNSSRMGVFMGEGEPGTMILNSPTLWNDFVSGNPTFGVHSSAAYTSRVIINGGLIRSFQYGVEDSNVFAITGTRFENWQADVHWSNFPHLERSASLANLTFTDLPPDATANNFWIANNRHEWAKAGKIVIGQGGNEPLYDATFDPLHSITYSKAGTNYYLVENAFAPADAVALPELVNAKAVQIGVTPPPANNPPVVSAITPTPADVDPATPGVQEYVGPVSYAFTASDPDGDALTVKVFYSVNGGARQQYNGTVTSTGWTFTYQQLVNYTWTVQADDGKGGVTESSLVVQVINQPTPPPAQTIHILVTTPDGQYEGDIPKKP